MLKKEASGGFKKIFKGGIKTFLVLEVLGIVGGYAFYHHTNTDRDFRLYLKDKFPPALEYYYKIGESLDSNYRGRTVDLEYWTKEGRN